MGARGVRAQSRSRIFRRSSAPAPTKILKRRCPFPSGRQPSVVPSVSGGTNRPKASTGTTRLSSRATRRSGPWRRLGSGTRRDPPRSAKSRRRRAAIRAQTPSKSRHPVSISQRITCRNVVGLAVGVPTFGPNAAGAATRTPGGRMTLARDPPSCSSSARSPAATANFVPPAQAPLNPTSPFPHGRGI